MGSGGGRGLRGGQRAWGGMRLWLCYGTLWHVCVRGGRGGRKSFLFCFGERDFYGGIWGGEKGMPC